MMAVSFTFIKAMFNTICFIEILKKLYNPIDRRVKKLAKRSYSCIYLYAIIMINVTYFSLS